MSGDRRPPGFLRRAGAVLAGVIAVVVLSVGTDAVLFAAGVYPPRERRMSDGLFLVATAYRMAYAVAGSFVAARLAPDRPMTHALWVGGMGLAAGLAGAVVARTAEADLGPMWYSVAVLAMAMPCAWAGGRLEGAHAASQVVRA